MTISPSDYRVPFIKAYYFQVESIQLNCVTSPLARQSDIIRCPHMERLAEYEEIVGNQADGAEDRLAVGKRPPEPNPK